MDKQLSDKKKVEVMEVFLKDAFCITEGFCRFVEFVEVHSNVLPIQRSMLFELWDEKRGTFYVTLSS